jgi:hypothetical protein
MTRSVARGGDGAVSSAANERQRVRASVGFHITSGQSRFPARPYDTTSSFLIYRMFRRLSSLHAENQGHERREGRVFRPSLLVLLSLVFLLAVPSFLPGAHARVLKDTQALDLATLAGSGGPAGAIAGGVNNTNNVAWKGEGDEEALSPSRRRDLLQDDGEDDDDSAKIPNPSRSLPFDLGTFFGNNQRSSGSMASESGGSSGGGGANASGGGSQTGGRDFSRFFTPNPGSTSGDFGVVCTVYE